jgi:hypothetical protein
MAVINKDKFMKTDLYESILQKTSNGLWQLTLQLVFSILFILMFNVSHAQSTGIVSGVVTDAESGEPGIGVNVMIKGTLLGTFTDSYGTYVITRVPAGDQILVFTGVGFEPYEKAVTIMTGQELKENVSLNVFTTVLGEVLVSGLRKSQITSNNALPIAHCKLNRTLRHFSKAMQPDRSFSASWRSKTPYRKNFGSESP